MALNLSKANTRLTIFKSKGERMAKITLTQKDLPNSNDFKKWLEQTEKRHSTVNEIFNLTKPS
jgi:hypothetical protein